MIDTILRPRISISRRVKRPKVNGKKIGRNDPCLCGSGKKFKKCCGLLRG